MLLRLEWKEVGIFRNLRDIKNMYGFELEWSNRLLSMPAPSDIVGNRGPEQYSYFSGTEFWYTEEGWEKYVDPDMLTWMCQRNRAFRCLTMDEVDNPFFDHWSQIAVKLI